MPRKDPDVLTVAETAKRFRVTPKTAYKLIAADEFPVKPFKIGGRIRFSRIEVERFLAGTNDGGTAA